MKITYSMDRSKPYAEIEAGDVPDELITVLEKYAPQSWDFRERKTWHIAIAELLGLWENEYRVQPAAGSPAVSGPHEHAWLIRGCKEADLLGQMRTRVLMRCAGCGTVQTVTLDGLWSPADVAGTQASGGAGSGSGG